MNALEIAATIAYLNLLTLGNGPALVPLLDERFVGEEGGLTVDQLLYAFAISRVTPGQANAYVASVGFFMAGLPGAILSTLAIQLPGYLMLPLMRVHERFREVVAVQRFTRSLTATTVGVILATTVRIGRDNVTSLPAVIVFGLAFVMAYVLKWNQFVSLALAAGVGLALHYLA